MDYRNNRGCDRRRDLRAQQPAPRVVVSERLVGPDMTESIHRELFSDYRATSGLRP